MKSASRHSIVLVTAPDRKTGRQLATKILTARLAACVNLVPGIESHYWWQDRLESAGEVLLVIKTARAKLAALERCVLEHHPYDTPECLALPLEGGTARYLAWIDASLRGPAAGKRKKVA